MEKSLVDNKYPGTNNTPFEIKMDVELLNDNFEYLKGNSKHNLKFYNN